MTVLVEGRGKFVAPFSGILAVSERRRFAMRRSPVLLTGIALAVIAVLSPTIGLCQFNVLNIFSDGQGTNCLVSDTQPGTITVYVFHNTNGATASQFRIATDAGFTGTYISHQVASPFLDLGIPPDDYSVAYCCFCYAGSFLVTTISYLSLGTSAPCSHMSIEPAPTSPIPGEVAVIDCDFELSVGTTSGPAVVNYMNCPAWCISATEPSNWGRIKALYR